MLCLLGLNTLLLLAQVTQAVNGVQSGSLPITDLKLEIIRTIDGTQQSGAVVTDYEPVSGQNPTASDQNFTGETTGTVDFDNGQVSNNAAGLDAFKFALYYKDPSSANWQLAATSSQVELRMPVFAGFTTATSSITGPLVNDPNFERSATYSCRGKQSCRPYSRVVKGLSITFGGWSAGEGTVPDPYSDNDFTGATFPRWSPIIGKSEDADDSSAPTSSNGSGGGYQYQAEGLGSTYGWVHNTDTDVWNRLSKPLYWKC